MIKCIISSSDIGKLTTPQKGEVSPLILQLVVAYISYHGIGSFHSVVMLSSEGLETVIFAR